MIFVCANNLQFLCNQISIFLNRPSRGPLILKNDNVLLFVFVFMQMNPIRFAIVVVLACFQLFVCSLANVGRPTRANKPAAMTAAQRRSGGSGYVDFGAHTGPLGSYGWYADFPANKNN